MTKSPHDVPSAWDSLGSRTCKWFLIDLNEGNYQRVLTEPLTTFKRALKF